MLKAVGVVLGLLAVAWVVRGLGEPAKPPVKYLMPDVIGLELHAAKAAIADAIPNGRVIDHNDSSAYEREHQCLWRFPPDEPLDPKYRVVHSAEYPAGTELEASQRHIDVRGFATGQCGLCSLREAIRTARFQRVSTRC